MKWVIAELVNDEQGEHWVRRTEEFESQQDAERWIERQSNGRFEARELADGETE